MFNRSYHNWTSYWVRAFITWAHQNFKLVMLILTAFFYRLSRLDKAGTTHCRVDQKVICVDCLPVRHHATKLLIILARYHRTLICITTATWQHLQVTNDLNWHQERNSSWIKKEDHTLESDYKLVLRSAIVQVSYRWTIWPEKISILRTETGYVFPR